MMRIATSIVLLICLFGITSTRAVSIGADSNIAQAAIFNNLLAYNDGANASVALEGSFVQKVFNELLPIIEAVADSIAIPGESEKHFKFDSFSLSSFSIGSIVTSFQAPNTIVAGVNDLSLSVPKTGFKVFDHIFEKESDFEISCSGHFWGSVSGSDISLSLNVVTSADGKLSVTSVNPTINFGSVNINHDIDGFFCKVGQDIINLFLGNLNNLIAQIAEKDLPGIISSKVESIANEALPKVPVTFVSQPLVVNDTLQLSVQLLAPFGSTGPSAVAVAPSAVPASFAKSILGRDVAIGINTQSFNDLIAAGAATGKFSFRKDLPQYNTSLFQQYLPQVYNACPNCPIGAAVTIQPNQPPTGIFYDDTMTFSFTNAILELDAKNVSDSNYTALLSVYANLTFSLDNFTITNESNYTALIDFVLSLSTLSLLPDTSVVGNLDIQVIGQLLQDLLQAYVIPDFNAKFQGFPLTVMKDGVGLSDWAIKISSAYSITLGANIVLPNI
jgi:hypothetical protein